MENRLKRLIIGSVPAICGISAVAALGEKISWPEGLSPQMSFAAATQPAGPASQPVLIREDGRQIPMKILGERP